jgi:hypothetical protein
MRGLVAEVEAPKLVAVEMGPVMLTGKPLVELMGAHDGTTWPVTWTQICTTCCASAALNDRSQIAIRASRKFFIISP